MASGNAAAFGVVFDLGSGATYRAPAGAWVAGNFLGANGAASIVATNGAVFQITGVKLEIGSVATPFNRYSLAKSMIDCQRYYQTSYYNAAVGAPSAPIGQLVNYIYTLPVATNRIMTPIFFPVTMRSQATATIYSPVTGLTGKARDGAANVDVAAIIQSAGAVSCSVDITTSGNPNGLYFQYHYTASAEL